MEVSLLSIIGASLFSAFLSSLITVSALKRDIHWINKALDELKQIYGSRITKLEERVRKLEIHVYGKPND
ncbi:hypothetical protein PQE20_27420 (plasmid) [Vibrio harveyi]|uniref:hypothetical protein n=1 Tax=Vibrio harveyi TaxID=669 RepID=UPI00234D6460|nr:hypothetical protein [Vibrio harveyi]WCP84211.1 hypothetical protein PQE20_27420 [Vibrio harveyi]